MVIGSRPSADSTSGVSEYLAQNLEEFLDAFQKDMKGQ